MRGKLLKSRVVSALVSNYIQVMPLIFLLVIGTLNKELYCKADGYYCAPNCHQLM